MPFMVDFRITHSKEARLEMHIAFGSRTPQNLASGDGSLFL